MSTEYSVEMNIFIRDCGSERTTGLLTKNIGYIGYRISDGINRGDICAFLFSKVRPNNMQNRHIPIL